MFIAMACYDGESLKDRIERGLLPGEEILEITRQIAEGMNRAHKNGIVHRDHPGFEVIFRKAKFPES